MKKFRLRPKIDDLLHRFFCWLLYFFLKFSLSLRYRVEVKGLQNLTNENLNKSAGTLFLANHPAEIDPCILFRILWPKFRIHPVAIDYLFQKPFVRYFLDLVEALPVPNFEISSNSFKRASMEKTYETIFSLLKKKENILIYPAGGLKTGPREVLGGSSGTHAILQREPNANVVLIRTTGLWGSSFSRALTGRTLNLEKAFKNGLKMLLKNFIFFTPRRKVLIELTPAPKDFPWSADKLTLNRYLENWFNAPPQPEPLTLVSYSCFKEVLPKVKEKPKEETFSLDKIPQEISDTLKTEIAKLARVDASTIGVEQNLAVDLGLDSLDIAQLVVILRDGFGIQHVNSSDLTTVGSVFAYAAGLKKPKTDDEEIPLKDSKRKKEKKRPEPLYPDGETLLEVFFKSCDRMNGFLAGADLVTGDTTYKKLKFGVLLLAEAIKKIPGERIGILMPASVAVNAVIFATILAKKIPVMVNWTLGPRNLASIVEQSQINVTLSSWAFLNRLENVELGVLDKQLVLLEDIRRAFLLSDYWKAYVRSKKSYEDLSKIFHVDNLKGNDQAVILFTSGTESFPKGVPLTHKNLISNHRNAFKEVKMEKQDILLGALPPFHSFGFSVTGILPILVGLFVGFTPNPTDGRRMAQAISKWKVTLLCLAPTFMKNLLRVASGELQTVRLAVLGAEKTPPEIYEKMEEVNPQTLLIEGYGITECSPILTLNSPDNLRKGTVGKPLSQVEILIVNPETNEKVEREAQGHILAFGPNIFEGYLDPKLPSPFIELEGKKWYKTGDLGFLDHDGYLTLSGRLKRFAKIGGEMISLAAIEETLLLHAEKMGWPVSKEVPSLAVVAKEQDAKKTELHLFTTFDTTSDSVNKILKESGMSNLVKIRAVHPLRFIPLLGTGKIDYRNLTSKLQNN